MTDDRDLVQRLRQGDPGAFDVVYERYRPRLHSFLARLTRDRESAEDLLQETWLRLTRHATRLDPDTEVGAWLFTVARNLHVSWRRWRVLDIGRRQGTGRTSGSTTPFDLVSAGETERAMEAAIGKLAPRLREVLLLVAVERFEPAQVARMLGLTPEAVRQRLSRARAAIAAAVAGAAASRAGAS